MATTKRIYNREMKEIIGRLSRMVKQENKQSILQLWDEVQMYDFQEVDKELFDEYNELVDKANELIY
jgi:hypothetical protein